MNKKKVPNYFSIDIESWAYGDTPELRNLSSKERKQLDNGFLLESTNKVLDLLAEHETNITMFMIGEQFEWYPELVENIIEQGHELGMHGYIHYQIESPDHLRRDLEKAAPLIEKYGIRGYRAPVIYLPAGGFDILSEFGLRFDSSSYGPFSLCGDYHGIYEVPISSLRFNAVEPSMFLPRHLSMANIIGEREIPFGSSYFTGLFGRKTKSLMRHLNRQDVPSVVFIHNWQIFPPRQASFPTTGYLLSHPAYWPLTRNLERFCREMLSEFRLEKIGSLLVEPSYQDEQHAT